MRACVRVCLQEVNKIFDEEKEEAPAGMYMEASNNYIIGLVDQSID